MFSAKSLGHSSIYAPYFIITFRTNIFSDEMLISSLKQDLSNGISGGGVGAAAAKGWPIFSAAIATGLFTASRWTDGSLWITSDVVITGGNMYPFLFVLSAPRVVALASSSAQSEAEGRISYSYSRALRNRNIKKRVWTFGRAALRNGAYLAPRSGKI